MHLSYSAKEFIIAFAKVFPFFSITIHYLILILWYGNIGTNNQCEIEDIEPFLAYWVPHLTVVFIISLCIHLATEFKSIINRTLFALWKALLSTLLFTCWSFIREEPFKCTFNYHLIYVYSTLSFVIIHILTIISCYVYAKKYYNPELITFSRLEATSKV